MDSSLAQPYADAKTTFAIPSYDEDEDDIFNLLEEECTEAAVTFIDDPYSSLLVFQSSASYVTINCNEESCGSSFSDFGTSLMVSVDMSGFRFPFNAKPEDEVLPPLTFLQVSQELLHLNSQI